MRLLLDEDSLAKELVILLREAHHEVLTVTEADLTGQEDDAVLNYARQTGRILLTRNCRDFELLHKENPGHPSIVCAYEEQERRKTLSYPEVVNALANLAASGWNIAGQFVALNPWNFTPLS